MADGEDTFVVFIIIQGILVMTDAVGMLSENGHPSDHNSKPMVCVL